MNLILYIFVFVNSFNLVKKGSRRRDAELGTRETIARTNFAGVCPCPCPEK